MAKPNEKLADALRALKRLQGKYNGVIESGDITAANPMLASGGYPWSVIRVQRRSDYISALEKASSDGDIKPLTLFIAEEMRCCPGF